MKVNEKVISGCLYRKNTTLKTPFQDAQLQSSSEVKGEELLVLFFFVFSHGFFLMCRLPESDGSSSPSTMIRHRRPKEKPLTTK